MHLCRVDWIIVTRYCMVSLTGCIVAYTVRPERRGATCIRVIYLFIE